MELIEYGELCLSKCIILKVKYWKLRHIGYELLGCIQGVGKTKKKTN
jgi:hypothetical protein